VTGLTVRLARPDGADLKLITAWNAQPHVAAFWHQDWSQSQWRDELRRQLTSPDLLPCLVELDGVPVAYLELYRAATDRIAALYPAHPGDLGVHIAIGDPTLLGRGIGRRVLAHVAHALVTGTVGCQRVVAEPDARNVASVRAFRAAGFIADRELTLPEKTALLLIYSEASA